MSGQPPVTVLIQGGIACGKSTVTRLLCERGARYVDCDQIAHEVLETEAVKALVAEQIGAECVTPEGVDRSAVAARVFSDEATLKLLESWIHPRVRERVQVALQDALTPLGTPREVLIVDAAVAEKMKLTGAYDLRVFVQTDLATRQARAATRGWEDGELERREARQDSLADREARADFLLPNQGSLEEAARHVEEFWTSKVQPLR